MPSYARLVLDDSDRWYLAKGIPFEQALEISDYGQTIGVAPEEVAQPFRVEVHGASPGAMMTLSRGFQLDSHDDVFASPELAALLVPAALPAHTRLECMAVPFPLDLRTLRRKQPHEPRPYCWFWWQQTLGAALDLTRSSFVLRHRNGAAEEAHFTSVEDLIEAQNRAANTLQFEIDPLCLEWNDLVVAGLDLLPFQTDLFVSDGLANALRAAALPGVGIRPARTLSTR